MGDDNNVAGPPGDGHIAVRAPAPGRLLLGSASARRRKILADLGIACDVVAPEVEEVHWDTDPRGTVRENAARKNAWCRARFPQRSILTADTVVVFEGRTIGKPRSIEEAHALLRAFSGRAQYVYTGLAWHVPGRTLVEQVEESVVRFKPLTEAAIREYCARVDPLDKAGAYDIDQCTDLIIAAYTGSWTNIMGLPAEVVRSLLNA